MRILKNMNSGKRVAIASALAIIMGIGFSLYSSYSASAIESNSNTQVTVSYYTGIPSGDETYENAYLNGDSSVGRVSYTTKSLGRIQWGEPNSDGTYDVNYDAADVHLLGAYMNESEHKYQELYEAYLAAKKAVYE